jgi:hypothetical protein
MHSAAAGRTTTPPTSNPAPDEFRVFERSEVMHEGQGREFGRGERAAQPGRLVAMALWLWLAGCGAASDGQGMPDAGPGVPSAAVRVLSWPATPISGYETACTTNVPGIDDRSQWCGFLSTAAGGKGELWVANVTKIAAGAARCDRATPDNPDCRRLTANLAMVNGKRMGPADDDMRYAHKFQGRTLLYYSDQTSTAASDLFVGPAHAWQPGWPAPKELSPIATRCDLSSLGQSANCVENVALQTVSVDGDLMGGRVADGRVKRLARLKLFAGDGDVMQHGYLIARDTSFVVYSGVEATERETLWVTRTEDIGVRARYSRVAVGVAGWAVTTDSKRLLYIRDFNQDSTNPSGTLAMVALPLGKEVVLANNVGDFKTFDTPAGPDRGLMFRQDVKADVGTLKLVKDLTLPASGDNLVEVAPGATSNWEISADNRFVIFSKQQMEGMMDAFIAKVGSPGACALSMDMTAADWNYYGPFQPQGKVAFWGGNVDPATGNVQGWYGDPDGCKTPRKFVERVRWWKVVGDNGLLYAQAPAETPQRLIYATFDAGAAWPGTGMTIASAVGENDFALVNNGEGVVFALASDEPATNGCYVWLRPAAR